MIVGNIINCNSEINEDYFNCLTIEEFLEQGDSNLPTLVIGWSIVKENFEGVSILSKEISKETEERGAIYWTFSPTEKRGIYEDDLKKFKHRCYTDLIIGINTYNIDPIIYNIKDTKELTDKIKNLVGGIGYLFQDRIVYIYKDNNIHMLDIELVDFIGFNKTTVIDALKNTLSVFSDDLEEAFTEELKHLDIKYIPYLKFKDAT